MGVYSKWVNVYQGLSRAIQHLGLIGKPLEFDLDEAAQGEEDRYSMNRDSRAEWHIAYQGLSAALSSLELITIDMELRIDHAAAVAVIILEREDW